MFDFRFFEIYRSSEYMGLIFDGILISSSLTVISGCLGFIIAFLLGNFGVAMKKIIEKKLLPVSILLSMIIIFFAFFVYKFLINF